MPKDNSYWLDRQAYNVIAEWPFGKGIRQLVIDPVVFFGEPVDWPNYEASYDVRELEPAPRPQSTYVLPELFVTVEKPEELWPKIGANLNCRPHNPNNCSLRHAT